MIHTFLSNTLKRLYPFLWITFLYLYPLALLYLCAHCCTLLYPICTFDIYCCTPFVPLIYIVVPFFKFCFELQPPVLFRANYYSIWEFHTVSPQTVFTYSFNHAKLQIFVWLLLYPICTFCLHIVPYWYVFVASCCVFYLYLSLHIVTP